MMDEDQSIASGGHFEIPLPPGWQATPQESLADLTKEFTTTAAVDLLLVFPHTNGTFAPNCVATYEKVSQGDLQVWAEHNLRATIDLYPGTEVVDLGELYLSGKPSNSYTLFTYILNDRSVTCVQFVWHTPRNDGYVDVGIVNLQCLTDEYRDHSQALFDIIEFAQMLEGEDHVRVDNS